MALMPFRQAESPPPADANSGGTGGRRFRYGRLALFGMLAALLLLALACSTGNQSTWDPAGPVAQLQLDLFNVLVWVMLAVFVVVEGVLLYATIRFRRRPGQGLPRQVHGHTPLEVTWTIIPTVLILGLGIWSVIALFYLEKPPVSEAENALEVNVTGHQWWWEFEYPDAGGGKRITTANELRIPVDRAIVLNLHSDDVIHSFWVPELAGKVDVIPTRTNTFWFKADPAKIDSLPATFYGQCAEFCGIAHALMKFRVRVLSPADYDAWVQSYSPPPANSPQAQRGRTLFLGNCSFCHTIDGPEDPAVVAGRVRGFMEGNPIAPGPNLTDLRTRHTLAAGLVPLNQENLRAWLHDPDQMKKGNYMAERAPMYQGGQLSLSDDDVSAVIVYLLGLQ